MLPALPPVLRQSRVKSTEQTLIPSIRQTIVKTKVLSVILYKKGM